jgi:hypothetical protein
MTVTDLLQVVATTLIQAIRNKLLRARCHQRVNNLLCRTKLRQFSVSYQGSSFFNTLSNDTRNAPTLQQIQFKLRNFLFSQLCF